MKHSSHESNPNLAEQSIRFQAPAQSQGVGGNGAVWILAGLAIVAVIMLGNWDLLTGKAAPLWDAIAYYAPLFTLVGDHARAGRLLLWNPWMSGGSPDCADPQSGASSIVIVLFGLLFKNPMHAFVIYWFSFWIFGGLGMLLLCRYLKCPAWGATVAALGFAASGFYTGHAEHTALIYTYSFVPWIVWRFDKALLRRSWRYAIQAGLLWGLSALGGYPGMVILTFFFLMFWALGRVLWPPQEDSVGQSDPTQRRKSLILAVVGLLLVAAVSTIIMSPSYWAFFKYSGGYSSRAGGLTRQRAQEVPLPPQAMGTFSSPYLAQLSLRNGRDIWRESDVAMNSIYLGVIVAALAFVGLLRGSPWRIWLAVVAAFFFACSVGRHLPVRGWVYDLVLPTRYFRFPSLFSGYAMFACCVLAALASRDIAESSREDIPFRRKVFVIAVALCALATFFYLWILRTALLTVVEVRGVSIVAAVLWFALVWVALLWWRSWITYRGFVATVVLIALADAGSTFVIAQPIMYTDGTLRPWHAMMSYHSRNLELTGAGFQRSAFPPDDLGKYWDDKSIVVKKAVMAGDPSLVNAHAFPYAVDPVLSKIAVGEQRTWFSDQPIWSDPGDAAFRYYIAVSHQLGTPPLVLHKPEQMAPKVSAESAPASAPNWGNSAQAMSPATVHLIRYFPNRLEFDYTADKDGWLLVSDRWSPGWKATVNGTPVENTAANFVFRAVPVQRGENRIAFRFEPRGFVPLIIVSWSLLIVAGVWLFVTRARRPTGQQPAA